MTKVPTHLLVQTIVTEGQRLPKREKVYGRVVVDSRLPSHYKPIRRPMDELVALNNKIVGAVKEFQRIANRIGNLKNEDYRYWTGTQSPASSFARCRGCNKPVYSPWQMKDHITKLRCGKLLDGAYELLRRDAKCVICDAGTGSLEYGVYLCSSRCGEHWRFDVVRPKALVEAIAQMYRTGYKTPGYTPKPTIIEAAEAVEAAERALNREY